MNLTLKEKLKKDLAKLKELADKQTHLYISSRTLLYEGLAKAYLWWQDANKEKGLLEQLYNDNGIQYKKEINADINFSPLLRYLWGMDGTVNSNKIDLWNRTLNKVHIAVQADKVYYKQKAVDKIITYIETSGGISNLAAYDSTQVDVIKEPKSKPTKVDVNIEKKRNEQHLERSKVYYAKQTTPIAKFQSKHTLPTADSSIGLGLFRKTKNGYELLKAIDDKELIEKALINSYARSTDSVPYTVRLLTEIISTQTVPKPLQSLSRSLADKSKYKSAEGTIMMMLKRLTYVAEKKIFLLSANRSTCSTVTIVKPTQSIIASKESVALSINDRTYIEDNLIHSGDVNFYTTDTPTSLQAIKDEAATHKLLLENTITKKYRYIRFYPLTIHKTQVSKQQAILKQNARFHSVHKATLDKNWLAEFNGEFLSRWVNGLGKSIKRKEYAVLGLSFNKIGITFKFCQRSDSYVESELIKYTNPNTSKTINVEVLAKDIIPILNSLVYSDTVGTVTLELDSAVLLFKYKTHIAEYLIAVPTTDSKGKRNEKYFEAYGV